MLDILATGIFDSRERYRDIKETPLRTTRCYELEFYFSSSGTAVLNGNKYPHKRGLTLFITPETKRYSIGAFSCFYIHFMPDENILKLIKDFKTFPSFQDTYLSEQFYKIIELYNLNDADSRLEFEAQVLDLLKTVLFKKNFSQGAPLIQKAARFIENNFHKPLDLDAIAKEINLSSTYFHKKFKELYGLTPREYLLKLRIRHAKKLLLTENKSFLEISEECGFSSQAYFNFQFKKCCGMTPSQFRQTRYASPV